MTGILDNPLIFDLWSRITGDIPVKEKIISEHILAFDGARILDIGCGTGRMAELISRRASVSYVGIDLNSKYIDFAKQRNYPGVFHCTDIVRTDFPGDDFDIVLALDVLHHVDDEYAQKLISFARKKLKQNGRFILTEPVWTDQQSVFEKKLMRADRGKHIRSVDSNLSLLRGTFSEINNKLIAKSYFIPWTECVFSCK